MYHKFHKDCTVQYGTNWSTFCQLLLHPSYDWLYKRVRVILDLSIFHSRDLWVWLWVLMGCLNRINISSQHNSQNSFFWVEDGNLKDILRLGVTEQRMDSRYLVSIFCTSWVMNLHILQNCWWCIRVLDLLFACSSSRGKELSQKYSPQLAFHC